MHGEHGFTWLGQIPGLNELPNHVAMAILVGGLLVVLMLVARMQLARVTSAENKAFEQGMIPQNKLNFFNFFEILAEQLYKLTESVIGHHDAPRFFPLIGTMFVFIFVSNLFGLIPGVLPATDNLNTTLALGAFVFIYYNVKGIQANGLAYFKHFLGPVIWLAPLMLPIELIGHLARPLSLGLRLRGNIMGDHMVLGIFNGLVPYVIPVIFYGLGVFVSFMQAFVFCLLTMVYISMATSHDH